MQAQNGKIRKNEGSGNAMEEFKNLQETKLSSQPIFDGDVLHIYKDTVRLPNGRTSTREYTVHHGAVCVIPLLENGDVLLERQFRYAMGEVLTEIPAGKLDYIGEDPREAALRELREETGAVASELIPLGPFYPTCAYSTEVIHMFLARGLTFGERELDEDEFLGYKSWYLYYYDLAKKERERNVKTTLVDIDFNIELIRTDKINVVYILNLLKDVIKKDENEKKRSIDLVLREIERSDNERLRAKQEMLKRFVTEKFFTLSPDEDIVKAYEEFEVQQQNMDIEMFAEETKLDVETIRFFMSEYQFKHVISLEDIRKRLSQKGYGLIQTIKLSSEIEDFVKEQYEKFRAEGV